MKICKNVFCLVLVLALLLCTGCAASGQIRVACVGDSVTYGHGTTSWPHNTYPAVLQQLLGEQYHVNNYGASGFAVQDRAKKSYRTLEQYRQSIAYAPDIVVFMMGSNDTKPVNWAGGDAYRKDLLEILDSYGDTKVVLCTVPAAFFLNGQTDGVTNYSIQPLVAQEVAQIIREVSAERGCPLADIYTLTAQHPEWFAKDGVHPSDEGAAAIAREIYSVLRTIQN